MRAVARHPFFANSAWASLPVDLEGNPVVNRWVQPGEVLEVSDREEDWRDYFGAYLEPEPAAEAETTEKKRRKRKAKDEPDLAPEPAPEPEPEQAPEEVSEEAPGLEQGEQDLAPAAEPESEAEPTPEADQAEDDPAGDGVPE